MSEGSILDDAVTQTNLRVRVMQALDIPHIMPIETEIYPFPWTAGNFRDSLQAGYAGWVVQDRRYGGPRMAPVIAYAMVMHVLDEAHLMNLSVAADYQRRGLGRWLLEWLADSSHKRGAVGMFLEVRPSNLAALGLYEQAGFQRIGLRRQYYPNGADGREDAIVMRSALGSSFGSEGQRA